MAAAHRHETSSTQIQSWFRPVLMTWTMRSTWMMQREDQKQHWTLSPRSATGVPRLPRLRQREGHDVVAARRTERPVAAGADDDVLALVAAGAVGHRRRLAAGRQPVFPQLAAGLDVEGAQVAVHGGADEHQVAGGGDRTAHVRHAEVARRREPGRQPSVEPSGTCQTMRLRRRSTLTSVPHGGAVHGRPQGDSSGSRRIAVGRAGLARELRVRVVARVRLRCRVRLRSDQRHHHRQVVDGGDDPLARLIEHDAAPVDAADVARREDRAARCPAA